MTPFEMCKALLDNGAHVNVKNKGQYDRTELFPAVENKDYDVVKLFLDHGSDPNIVDATVSNWVYLALSLSLLIVSNTGFPTGTYPNGPCLPDKRQKVDRFDDLLWRKEKRHPKTGATSIDSRSDGVRQSRLFRRCGRSETALGVGRRSAFQHAAARRDCDVIDIFHFSILT